MSGQARVYETPCCSIFEVGEALEFQSHTLFFQALRVKDKALVLDMKFTESMDTAGIGMLELARDRCSSIYILNARESILKLMCLYGILGNYEYRIAYAPSFSPKDERQLSPSLTRVKEKFPCHSNLRHS